MTRIEIEATIARDRAGLLERVAALPPADLVRGVTQSGHDASSMWSAVDHLVHLSGIERSFNAMIRAHLAGEGRPVAIMRDDGGEKRTLEQIMAVVNAMNEEYVLAHRGKPLSAVVALGEATRAETLALMAELTDEQLAEKLPDAPWADGTIGGVISVNAVHGRMHWTAVQAALAGEPGI
jgi:hypothetical protein